MKSAYELAMERLNQTEGNVPQLTEDQRRRIADIASEFEAKRAESELALKPKIEAARVQGQLEEANELQEHWRADLARIAEREEAAKQAVRDETAPPDGESTASSE